MLLGVKRVARIAHLSDLHYEESEPGLRSQVENILHGAKPDFVVVTGDLVETNKPRELGYAKDWLDSLVAKLTPRPRLIVIPGNHDLKPWGTLGVPLQSRRSACAPFLDTFRGDDRTTPIKKGVEVLAGGPGAEICFIGVWSAQKTSILATGNVTSDQLQELDTVLAGDEAKRALFRIVLVHHHPLPTRYKPKGYVQQYSNSLMAFHNAGQFLESMVRHECDLVLHGHRHFAGHAQYSLETGGHGVSVISAGTATRRDSDDQRGNHLNLIDLFYDGTARMESRFFSDSHPREDATREFELIRLVDVARKRNVLAAQACHYRAAAVRKWVTVGQNGYSDIVVQFQSCGALDVGEGNVPEMPIKLSSGTPTCARGTHLTSATSSSFRRPALVSTW